MKACSICKAEKEASAFNWRNKAKGWLRPECRACQSNAAKRAKARDPVAHNAASAARKRKWRADNPEAGRLWYAAHKEQETARYLRRCASPEFCEKRNARSRAWYAANKEQHRAICRAWHARNRERVAAYFQQHYADNKAAYFERSRRCRALKLGRTVVPFSQADLDARMSVFGHRCAYCNGPFEHIDHVIPLARGGLHCLANLRPACRACNLRKSAKPISVWLSEVA